MTYGLAALVALVLVVALIGWGLTRLQPGTPAAASSAPLTLPLKVGEFGRDPTKTPEPSLHPDSKVETVSATYSRGGLAQFIVLASRPQSDATEALTSVDAVGLKQYGSGVCGRTPERNSQACVVIARGTAYMAVTLVDHTPEELVEIAKLVERASS